jgi:DNA-binding winged helix-turn-helix (wHTH) protein
VLLEFLIEHDGELVTRDQLAEAVWPELSIEGHRVGDAVLDETIRAVADAIDDPESGFTHIEKLSDNALLFMNTDYPGIGGCD